MLRWPSPHCRLAHVQHARSWMWKVTLSEIPKWTAPITSLSHERGVPSRPVRRNDMPPANGFLDSTVERVVESRMFILFYFYSTNLLSINSSPNCESYSRNRRSLRPALSDLSRHPGGIAHSHMESDMGVSPRNLQKPEAKPPTAKGTRPLVSLQTKPLSQPKGDAPQTKAQQIKKESPILKKSPLRSL